MARPDRPLLARASMPPVLKHLDPEPHHALAAPENCWATALRSRSHKQGADDCKPDITALVRRSLHRHQHLPQRGVLCIGLCLLMAQPPPYRQILCNNISPSWVFSEISFENRSRSTKGGKVLPGAEAPLLPRSRRFSLILRREVIVGPVRGTCQGNAKTGFGWGLR